MTGTRNHRATIARSVVLVAAVVILVALPAGGVGTTLAAAPRSAPGPGPADLVASSAFAPVVPLSAAYNWPELHQSPLLHGFASNSPLSSTNASQLGVAWDTDLYGSALDSPVVAYDPLLHEALAYVGTEGGDFLAINIANGQIVWGVWLGSPILSSPLVYNGSVYTATFVNPTIFRLNSTTGAVQAAVISPAPIEATPTLATPPKGVPTLYIGTLDDGSSSGPFLALNAENLSTEWSFTGYNVTAGSWDSASYVVNAEGVPMVLFGTDNPDSSVYALNALTGRLLWRFQCLEPNQGDWDVAAGVAISAPGVNGFAQGVAYAINKISYAYALDLNNGTLIWETNFDKLAGHSGGVSRSTAAIDGTNLIFGYPQGLIDLNAKTGAEFWVYQDPTKTESIASPAIAGGHGTAVAITGDVAGFLDVVAVHGGAQLYQYQTGGYITGSPAVYAGNIIVASSNGYLYDFAVGGGDDTTLPTTTLSSPVTGSSLANPAGSLTIRGNATDPKGVAMVDVAIQSGGSDGPWWDGATGTWSPGPVDNPATLHSPNGLTTSWQLALPVPAAGGSYTAYATAASVSGQSDLVGAQTTFSVNYSTQGPHLEASSSFAAPGTTLTVKGGGFGRSVKVNIALDGRSLKNVTAAANGSLALTTVTVPADASFGLSALVATGPNASQTVAVPLDVTNSWDQLGGGPGRVGYESNDLTYNYLIFPGGNNWEQLAWHFEPERGAGFDTSPAIVDGVAYVANSKGSLYAVDITNGGMLWNFTLGTGAAIYGSPAVDVGQGLVFIGASDGTLDAVHLSTGTLAWSATVGGNVSSPLLSGGTVFASSSSGKVEALSESGGGLVWADTLGHALTAPSLNAATHLLVLGESNGSVVALNASTGVTRWTHQVGGSVLAAPMLVGTAVYVGSTNDKVVSLAQATGAQQWSFAADGSVTASLSFSENRTNGQATVFVGTSSGFLYALSAANAKVALNISVGAAIVGVSTANGIAIIETANGHVSATRTYVSQLDWTYKTGSVLSTQPVLEDGAIFVCAANGNLYAFTSNGQPPV